MSSPQLNWNDVLHTAVTIVASVFEDILKGSSTNLRMWKTVLLGCILGNVGAMFWKGVHRPQTND